MNNVFLYSYNSKSQSAKALSEALGIKRIKRENSKFNPQDKYIINWGCSEVPSEFSAAKWIVNQPELVGTCTNKIKFFKHQSSFDDSACRLVPWTTEKDLALVWFNQGDTLVCRTKLTGHSGDGIILVNNVDNSLDDIPDAPLYTKYVPKDSEWRVHISSSLSIMDVQRKIRDPQQTPTEWRIRAHKNGFIYVRNSGEPPQDVLDQANKAFLNSGLDFGAVDVIYNKNREKAYVLEINTAPGLQGQTLEKYVEALSQEFVDV
jgi:glutathione synthase/RimK-type ligase-like ATP-grasp enzyme